LPAVHWDWRVIDDQVLLFLDPAAKCQLLEQCTIEPTRRAVIDIFDGGPRRPRTPNLKGM
jgi:hypothetical protein